MKRFPEIPGYVIKKKLGRGGMANVYMAVQENLSRLVAIKALIPEYFSVLRTRKRFIKEAQIASKLVHPNIVTIYDVGRTDEFYYIVMEYLQESLKERIRRMGRFAPEEAIHILLCLGSALFYAHRRGFIHRDIKSENIMFRKDGTPVIVDFGIARAIESQTKLTQTGIFVGTPNYMSPEQCLGKRLDGRSDVYSLGVVFYEMLTGVLPFKGADMRQVVVKHIKGEVPRLSFGLRRYQPIIDNMMARKYRQRLRTEPELVQLVKPLMPALALSHDTAKGNGKNRRGEDRDRTQAVALEAASGTASDSKTPAPSRPKRHRFRRRLFFILVVLITLALAFLYLGAKYGFFGLDKLFRFW